MPVEIMGSETEMPVELNLDLIRTLQERVAPTIFAPRVAYDGRKNMFASRSLNLFGDSQTVSRLLYTTYLSSTLH